MGKHVKVGLLGCGTIGQFFLDCYQNGKLPDAELIAVCVRNENSQGIDKAKAMGLTVITDAKKFVDMGAEVVIESASHAAVEIYGEYLLSNGVTMIPMSLGSLVDPQLLERMTAAAEKGNSQLIVPSGGIGALDAMQAAMVPGVESVRMITRKAPVAWKHIEYVEQMGWDLDNMTEPTLLFDGPAKDCVKKFPQNINIAAALSLATIGFEKTQITIYADPGVKYNTHQIIITGPTGKMTLLFENTPVPTYPRTTYLACTSVVAALQRYTSHYRIGT